MRSALPFLVCLPTLASLACGSPKPEPGDSEPGDMMSAGGPIMEGTTAMEGDPSAGASGSTDTDADPTGAGTTGDATIGDLSTGDATTGAATTGAATTGAATTGAAEELPPFDSAEALELWLAGGAYKQWAAESKVHASAGPHGGNVRTYVNAIALGSLAAQQAEHPQDAAIVKELYANSVDTLIGYAVMRKTAPKSEAGATWYWYERIDATVYADGLGVLLCSGCHGAGADFILTPYPLQ